MANCGVTVLVGSVVILLLITQNSVQAVKSEEVRNESGDLYGYQQPWQERGLTGAEWKSLKQSKHLSYLFRKYGSGGLITFEGLEHMMHNLGLGGLEFVPNHAVEQHHPEGYRVFEESLREGETELKETKTTNIVVHFERSTTEKPTTKPISATSTPKKHVIEINIDEDQDQDEEEIVVVKESQHHRRSDDGGAEKDKITVQVNREDDPDEETQDSEAVNEISKDQPTFISMHDPKHQHLSRGSDGRSGDSHAKDHNHGDLEDLSQQPSLSCLSPSAVIKLLFKQQQQQQRRRQQRHVNDLDLDSDHLENEDDAVDLNSLSIKPKDFLEVLCPVLLTQIERAECVAVNVANRDRNNDHVAAEKKPFRFAWLYATITILIISMCGLVGVAIVPLMRSSSYNFILMFLVAVAVGTLAGDALMHLLPHALTPHLDHGNDTLSDPHQNDESVYLCGFAFLAAVFMYVLETLLPLLLGGSGGHHHSHHHHHHPVEDHSHGRDRRSSSIIQEEMTLEPEKTFKVEQLESSMEIRKGEMEDAPLSPVAFMVFIGDGLHNITDGLAIGAAFAADPITGMATALAVLCHELPHELGDFALLLKTGVSIKRALVLNVVSSVLSLIGMAFGLFIAGIHTSMVRWIYAATSGTFLYIAMADLIPEMSKEPEGKSLKAVLCQVSGILIGGLIMLTIALNEDRLRILFE